MWCRNYTMTMTTPHSVLTIVGMIPGALALIPEIEDELIRKAKNICSPSELIPFFLMFLAISLGEPAFIVLDGLNSFAAFTAIFFARCEVAEHLIEDTMLI
ncbi:MAG: hypothetical protein O3A74_00580 [archaeon]|nr:hypothetical protein [archaeon]